MPLAVLQAELERLFELQQLKELSQLLLAVDPSELSASTAKGSFAAALVQRCVETDSVEALCDAVLASREGVDPTLADLRKGGFAQPEELKERDSLGPYLIERKLGEGPAATAYVAHRGAQPVRMKLLRAEAAANRVGMQRFFTLSRLLATLKSPLLPQGLVAGPVGDRWALVHDYVEGQPLASRLAAKRPTKLRHLWPLLRQILEALCAIHARRVAHGNLHPGNLLVVPQEDEAETIVLLDAGAQYLRAAVSAGAVQSHRIVGLGAPHYVAPEQIKGEPPTPSSDVYSFGALLYELLCGQPVFSGSEVEVLVGHLDREPEPLSFAAPRRWISSELDEFVMQLLDKDPAHRPLDAEGVLDVLETIAGHSLRRDSSFPEKEFEDRVSVLLDKPTNELAAAVLEAAVDQGADPTSVADAFRLATESLDDSPEAQAARKRLLMRSGALYETVAADLDGATQSYELLLQVDPADDGARAALERVYRRHGKYEKLVDMLLEHAQKGSSSVERARTFAKLGAVLQSKLGDPEQALVAYTQALCVDPSEATVVDEIERLAGSRQDAWNEVLSSCIEAMDGDLPPDRKSRLLARMGHWYSEKTARPDLAVRCFQSILAYDPAHDVALAELATLYRRAQQWQELSSVLALRANAAVTPAQARDLRTKAAQILEERLGDTLGAAQLYEQVLDEDPAHQQAGEALTRLYERTGDTTGCVRVMEQRAAALSGEARQLLVCRLAQTHETRLQDTEKARQLYQQVLEENATNLDALRGLECLYTAADQYQSLVANLEQQLDVAVTPHQKLVLLERIARIHEEQFHDHEKAADVLEWILEIDASHQEVLERTQHHYSALRRWSDLARIYERHIESLDAGPQRIEKLLALGKVCTEDLGDTSRALKAYEGVLAIDPQNTEALNALAQLGATTGDEERALLAIEALADGAASPESRGGQYLRAARLCAKRGDLKGAMERYKQALDANPNDEAAGAALRALYVRRGDVESAIELLQRHIARIEGPAAKARLCVELAELYLEHLDDAGRAEATARHALEHDPSKSGAHRLLANLDFAQERFDEAAKHFKQALLHTEAFDNPEAAHFVGGYLDALARAGAIEQARAAADGYLGRAPDTFEMLRAVSKFFGEHGPPARAFELAQETLLHFEDRLDPLERAAALLEVGEAARRDGNLDAAIEPLEKASELDPLSTDTLQALAKVYEAKQQWVDVSRTLLRQLERVSGEERVSLLIDVGDLADAKLEDPDTAAQSYLAALAEQPANRKILLKLVHLYSEEKDWSKLVDVIVKLTEIVEDEAQKAKYLLTAARVAAHELDDRELALSLLVGADPTDAAPEALVR